MLLHPLKREKQTHHPIQVSGTYSLCGSIFTGVKIVSSFKPLVANLHIIINWDWPSRNHVGHVSLFFNTGTPKLVKENKGDLEEQVCEEYNGMPLPIPDFTPIVKFGLRSGDSTGVWKHMMDQCFNFYSANYLNACDGVAVYQQIGRDIYRRYKSVARDGKYI